MPGRARSGRRRCLRPHRIELQVVKHAAKCGRSASCGDPDIYGDESRSWQRTIETQEKLLAQFEELGGQAYEGRVRSILRDMGFNEENDFALRVEALSGGQKKLVGLAKLLVQQPNLLLLDEPDNHLDLRGKEFLERLIGAYQGGVVIVSHDRYLLDLVVDEIAELEDGKLTIFPGDYSEYAFEKQARLLRQQQVFQAQQKEVQRLEESAKRLLIWGRTSMTTPSSSAAVRSHPQPASTSIERIDKPIMDRGSAWGWSLSGWRGSNKVLEINDLDKSLSPRKGTRDENIVLAGLDLLIWRGERVGLVGPNGAGKSVLFRLILEQEEPTAGRIAVGPSSITGYYAQEHETLDYKRTLIETVRHAATFTESNAVSFLGKFLFNYEQARSPVSTLSGGERSRLQMALLMLTNANFLLLDEPTNNLDIPSAEVLEDALSEFEGTVLVISHDRYFLDRVVDRIVELDEGMLQEYVGNYSDYQAAKQKQKVKSR